MGFHAMKILHKQSLKFQFALLASPVQFSSGSVAAYRIRIETATYLTIPMREISKIPQVVSRFSPSDREGDFAVCYKFLFLS